MRLYDPCCGTGTLLIEAAFRQEHRAPGLTRAFAMEQFSISPAEECRQIRETCKADVLPDHVFGIAGSDKDPEALELARRHVRQAGLEGKIELTCQPLEKLMDGRRLYQSEGIAEKCILPCEGSPRAVLCAAPIIAAGDVTGVVALLTEDRTATPDAAQLKAVNVAAAFLARQMEE